MTIVDDTPTIDTNSDAPYPALTEMGIARFNEIAYYSLRQDGSSQDVLRVHYHRAKGSFLPSSRKYRFGRAVKSIVADSGTGQMRDIHEISPFLLRAVAELDSIVKDKRATVDVKSQLVMELDELEKDVAGRIDFIRKRLAELDG